MKNLPIDPLNCSSKEEQSSGILLINKPKNKTSFSLVGALRRLLKVKKIGHAGTLDPFATGVMVMLIGKQFTKLSDRLLESDKEYLTIVHLGIETDSYDCEGVIVGENSHHPSLKDVESTLKHFQGEVLQIPPMFSAKKKNGKKLYELARKGISIEREPVKLKMTTELIDYSYPYIKLRVSCSKGTYIRSIAHDLGKMLGCGAHLNALERVRSGTFSIDKCIDGNVLDVPGYDVNLLKGSLIKDVEKYF